MTILQRREDVGEGNGIDVDNLSLVYVQTGIDEINVGDALVEYYNLGGMRVDAANAAPGLYIRRQGIRQASDNPLTRDPVTKLKIYKGAVPYPETAPLL